MADPVPTLPSPDLQAFREALAAKHPDLQVIETLMPRLLAQNLLEQAWIDLKHLRPRQRPQDPWSEVRARMESEVARERARRMHQWQLDPRRRTLRLRMEIRPPASELHPPALQSVLAQMFLASGLPLAMGLEKSPRPMVRLGHPLPAGTEGLSEWAEAILREAPDLTLPQVADRLNLHAAQGIRVLQVEVVPNHASPVLELCREAHWVWICPPASLAVAQERFARFAEASAFDLEKMGKVGGHKQVKRIDVRPLVLSLHWEQEQLHFCTRLSAGEALNPLKLLAAVMGWEPSAIVGLTRHRVDLAEDPRLASSGKYEPKLHNLFEDAVLLEGGSNIRLVEEDDDAPIVLHRQN